MSTIQKLILSKRDIIKILSGKPEKIYLKKVRGKYEKYFTLSKTKTKNRLYIDDELITLFEFYKNKKTYFAVSLFIEVLDYNVYHDRTYWYILGFSVEEIKKLIIDSKRVE